MASAFNKFNLTVQDWLDGQVNYSSDVFKVLLTDTQPLATQHHYVDIAPTELATGNGYFQGGAVVTMVLSNVAGLETVTVTIPNPTWIGVAPGLGPFRYAVFYDSVLPQSLQCWFDLGQEFTLGNAQFIALQPSGSFFTLQ